MPARLRSGLRLADGVPPPDSLKIAELSLNSASGSDGRRFRSASEFKCDGSRGASPR